MTQVGQTFEAIMTAERYAEFAALRQSYEHEGYTVAHTFVPVARRGVCRPILFVGRATRGWSEDEVATFEGAHAVAERLLIGVEAGKHKWPFFWQTLQIATGVTREEEPPPIAWSNLVKIGVPAGNPSAALVQAQRELCAEQLRHEIAQIKPRAVVLMVRNYGQEILEDVFGAEGWMQDLPTEDRVASKLCGELPVIWTNHPQAPGGKGYRKSSCELALRIIGGDWSGADWKTALNEGA